MTRQNGTTRARTSGHGGDDTEETMLTTTVAIALMAAIAGTVS